MKIFSVADLCGVVPGLGVCEMCQSFQGGVIMARDLEYWDLPLNGMTLPLSLKSWKIIGLVFY